MNRGSGSLVVGGILSSLFVFLLPGGSFAQEAPLQTFAPILIEGDGDLCDDEDDDGTVGFDDGIINCASADGSPQRPFIIAGWDIKAGPDPVCISLDEPSFENCNVSARCAGASVAAAISICGTTRHIRVERLSVMNTVAANTSESSPPEKLYASEAAILLLDAPYTTLHDIDVVAGGIGVQVEARTVSDPQAAPLHTNVKVAARLPEDSLGGASSDLADAPLALFLNSSATLEGWDIQALGRDVGLVSFVPHEGDAGAAHVHPKFVLRDSRIEDASLAGADLYGLDALVERSEFNSNGLSNVIVTARTDPTDYVSADASGGGLIVEGGTYEIRESRFELRGFGVWVGGDAKGSATLNHFQPSRPSQLNAVPTTTMALVLDYDGDENCDFAFHYNNLNFTRVNNRNFSCELDARFNWWGNPDVVEPDELQIDGDVNWNEPLSKAWNALPMVVVDTPRPNTDVHDEFTVSGHTSNGDGAAVDHVEASTLEWFWDGAVAARGGASWELPQSTSDLEPGPFSLFLRGCTASDCGPPTRLDLTAVPTPLPPIALLEARPTIGYVGHTIVLDGRGSYSPQGREITAYRFSFGDGSSTDWVPSPTVDVTYPEARTYQAGLDVRDALGLENTNAAEVLLHIQAPAQGKVADDVMGIPGPSLLLIVVAALLVGAQLRSKNRG